MAASLKNGKLHFFTSILLGFMKAYFKLEIKGLENLPAEGPGIFVANHQSYLDVLTLALVFEKKGVLYQNYWVIGKPTYQNPFLRWLFAVAPLIVVNGTVKKAETALKSGYFITVFPEGFYTWRKFLYDRGKTGAEPVRHIGNSAAILGFKTHVPIIPIGIRGTFEALPPYSIFPRPGKLSLTIGKPFRLEVPEPESVTEAMIAEKADFVMRQIDPLR